MDQPAPDASAKPAAHPLLVSGIVATAGFMENLDLTIIVTAMPVMAQSFGTTPVALSLGVTFYILALAVVLPASGWIADRYGPRNVFLCAIAVFTLASMLCGLTRTLPEFATARALQGAAAALMSPVGRLVILRWTDKKDLVRALNFVTAPILFGPVLGPPIGGFIVTYADWRWIFYLNLPIGLLGLLLVWRFIPDIEREAPKPFDVKGFVLNGIGLAGLLFGLDLMGHVEGLRWLGALIALAGIGAGVLAVRHYRRKEHPLVELTALKIPTFRISTIGAGVMFRFAMAAPIFVLPLYLQVGLEHTAFAAGMLILAHTGGDLVIKAVTTPLLRKLGFRSMLSLSAGGFGLLFLALLPLDQATPLWVVVALLFVTGVVRSLQLTAITVLQFADVPRPQMTGASTFASINQHVTRAIGVALAALLINLSALWRGAEGPQIFDFRLAFAACALLSLGAMVGYLALPRDAGAQVSAGR
jgi:EmrB/QacA subfamily drug resistance transporter